MAGYWDNTSSVPSTLDLDPRVKAYLRPDDRIVDLGCGPGRMLAALAREGRRVVGVDRNLSALGAAQGQGLAVARADLARLPFGPNAFDAAILHAVLTTVPTPAERLRVLAEAVRVGCRVLCLADFLRNDDLPYYQARYEAGLAETGEPGSFWVREAGRILYQAHHFTVDELSGLLGLAGWTVAHLATPTVRTRSGNRVTGVVLAAVSPLCD